ncbi:glycerophosphodiester phosphodiesterase [Paucisalibacillus globulus]|uniref:glycerophosphodiester phosphodiesterase n=1 Tax=Paucisalibacillus globulus TaxID=351095 RepID=UPI000423F79D|nr:glycerophosphodiester phosphodiesterase family protein [Paucisalibacillus globulus]
MVLNFAHRGSLTEAPENTLPAFQKAIEHGTKAMELDVQLTKDNRLIVCHDHKLTRFNKSATGLIKDYTLDEIKQIDVGASFNQEFEGTTISTLEEVLEICPKSILLNIEIKNIPVLYEGIEKILLQKLAEYNRLENIIISSFDHLALKKVQEINPTLPLGMLFHYRILNTWDYAKMSGLNIYSIHPNHVFVDQDFIRNCQNQGYKVYPYTVNTLDRYEELVKFDVDGVFSNTPDIFTSK